MTTLDDSIDLENSLISLPKLVIEQLLSYLTMNDREEEFVSSDWETEEEEFDFVNGNVPQILQDNVYGNSSGNNTGSVKSYNFGNRENTQQSQSIPEIDPSIISSTAESIGLKYEEIGTSVADLSQRLTDTSSISSESASWWQSIMERIPYLGGLIEPESGRLLLNIGEGNFALVTGDIQSIQEYMLKMMAHSATTAFYWEFPLLFGLEPVIVQEAEDIMIGSRDSDLSDFIDAARSGSVDVNNLDSEAIPLLNWVALQAGEQSTDLGENESSSDSKTVFAAAISGRDIFVHPYSDGLADNLIESIESIYRLVETAPPNQQTEVEQLLDEEVLDIVNDDNRWGITDNDLRGMADRIKRLEQDVKRSIETLIAEQTEAEEMV